MSDVIQYASQLGRLDFVSAILASLVAVGIFGFLEIRSRSKKEAAEVAEQHSKVVAERVANEYMQKSLPGIIKSYEELVRDTVSSLEADRIARAQEEDNDENI